MKNMTELKALDEGRAQQFNAMMEQLASMQAKYKGVRGELLEKVRAELMRLKPTPSPTPLKAVPPVSPAANTSPAKSAPAGTPPAKMLPSCRVCGRNMKMSGADTLICQNGHTRLAPVDVPTAKSA